MTLAWVLLGLVPGVAMIWVARQARAAVNEHTVAIVSLAAPEVGDVSGEDQDEGSSPAPSLPRELLAEMSHDLKSPLNSVIGFAEVLALQADGELSDEQLASVEAIRQSGEQLFQLVTEMVDLARVEVSSLGLERAWVPMVTVINDAVTHVSSVIELQGVELVRHAQPGAPPMRVDSVRVSQALAALLRTCVMQSLGGRVSITTKVDRSEGKAVIEIRHDGGGHPSTEASVQVRTAVASCHREGLPQGSVGLSVRLAVELLGLHGGRVEANDQPRLGFRIDLPLDASGSV